MNDVVKCGWVLEPRCSKEDLKEFERILKEGEFHLMGKDEYGYSKTADSSTETIKTDETENSCPNRLPCGICLILGRDCPKTSYTTYEITC